MEACFSGPSIALLTAIGGVVVTMVTTIFWLLMKSQAAQTAKAEAREAEWKRLALRGANEIIPSLALEVRGQVRDQFRELGEPESR